MSRSTSLARSSQFSKCTSSPCDPWETLSLTLMCRSLYILFALASPGGWLLRVLTMISSFDLSTCRLGEAEVTSVCNIYEITHTNDWKRLPLYNRDHPPLSVRIDAWTGNNAEASGVLHPLIKPSNINPKRWRQRALVAWSVNAAAHPTFEALCQSSFCSN